MTEQIALPEDTRVIGVWVYDRLELTLRQHVDDFYEYTLTVVQRAVTGDHEHVERFVEAHEVFARMAVLAHAYQNDLWLTHDLSDDANGPGPANHFRDAVRRFLAGTTSGNGRWQRFDWRAKVSRTTR